MTTQDSKPAPSIGPTNEQAQQEVDIALIKQTVAELEKSQSQRQADDFVPALYADHRFR